MYKIYIDKKISRVIWKCLPACHWGMPRLNWRHCWHTHKQKRSDKSKL